ncbi:AraC family transcriptional regulator [Lentzea sp. NPDC051838]
MARVAREVGYRSESAFSQAFRSALGTSPARYRRS